MQFGQQISVATVGRTNFIPVSVALELAKLHKYALLAWPTLQQASHLTGIKPETIKARCEKGRLEGYLDLTKRLRINPAELRDLKLTRGRIQQPDQLLLNGKKLRSKTSDLPQPQRWQPNETDEGQQMADEPLLGISRSESIPELDTCVVPSPLEPQIRIVTERDYGMFDEKTGEVLHATKTKSRQRENKPYSLSYDPERPFSVSDCVIGRPVTYGQHSGVIAKIIDDPFSPKIQVHFPNHAHPLMREVLLVVAKRH